MLRAQADRREEKLRSRSSGTESFRVAPFVALFAPTANTLQWAARIMQRGLSVGCMDTLLGYV